MVYCTDAILLSAAALCWMCSRLDGAHAQACSQLRQCDKKPQIFGMNLNVSKSPDLIIACSETIVVEKPYTLGRPARRMFHAAAFNLRAHS